MSSEVRVYVNGQPVIVPAAVDCRFAARGALGIPRGVGVAHERGLTGQPLDEPLAFTHGHTFMEGERFIVVGWENVVSIYPTETPSEPWQTHPDAWKAPAPDGDPTLDAGVPLPPGVSPEDVARVMGEPPLEDDHIEVDEWGLCVTVPQLELQLHEGLGAVVAVFGPWLREMVAGLADDQDRLAWSLLPDSDEQRKNVHEAVLRSLKVTPKSMTRGEEPEDDEADQGP